MARRKKIEFDGKSAKAVRSVYQEVRGMIPRIRFTILTHHNEEVSFELDYEEATKFLNEAIAAHTAIAPGLKVPMNYF